MSTPSSLEKRPVSPDSNPAPLQKARIGEKQESISADALLLLSISNTVPSGSIPSNLAKREVTRSPDNTGVSAALQAIPASSQHHQSSGMSSSTRLTYPQGAGLSAMQLNNARAYANLAMTLKPGETLDVNRTQMTKQQFLIKAIQLDLNFARAYAELSLTLKPGQSINANGTPMTKQQLLIKSIQLNPNYARAFVVLSLTLNPGEAIIVNGTPMTNQQLLIKSIQLNPNDARAYELLALTLKPGEAIIVNGTPMTTEHLLQKTRSFQDIVRIGMRQSQQSSAAALPIRAAPVPKRDVPSQSTIMSALGLQDQQQSSTNSFRNALPGQYSRASDLRTRRHEFLQTIRSDPSNSQAYAGLASTIATDLSVKLIDGPTLTYQELLEKAIDTIPARRA